MGFLDGDTARAAETYGLFATAWALMQFVASPILGALSDRFGRRPIILTSIAGLGLDYIFMALAPTLGWLFVGRVPILTHIRKVVHEACPGVEETMKWSAPHFDYQGQMMVGMAAFKEHCAFGFWKAGAVLGNPSAGEGMDLFGCLKSTRDLPTDGNSPHM